METLRANFDVDEEGPLSDTDGNPVLVPRSCISSLEQGGSNHVLRGGDTSVSGGLSFSTLTQGAFSSVTSSNVSKTLTPLKSATLFLIDRSEDLHTPSLHSTDVPFQSVPSNNASKLNPEMNTNTEITNTSVSNINTTISPTINPTIRCGASLAHRMFCTIPTHTSDDDQKRSAVGMTQFPPFAQQHHHTSQPPSSSSSSSSSAGLPLSSLYTAFPAVAGLPVQLPLTLR